MHCVPLTSVSAPIALAVVALATPAFLLTLVVRQSRLLRLVLTRRGR
jgi:hypothetical protein